MTSFDRLAVEAEYRRLGYSKGWSFLGTPERILRTASVGLVGLNPGGGGAGDAFEYAGVWDVPGNGYFDERWGPGASFSPIQLQVHKWYELLGLAPHEAFCAQFVPFRSPSWTSLTRKEDALAFATRLWSWVLETSPATLFVTMGKKPAEHLSRLLDGRRIAHLPTGWGSQTIDVWDTPGGRRIVAMPHPSRHRLFNRANGSSELAKSSFLLATDRVAREGRRPR